MHILQFVFVFFIYKIGLSLGQEKKGILFPRDSESRQTKNLDGLWNFRAEPKGASDLGINQEWYKQPLEKVSGILISTSNTYMHT